MARVGTRPANHSVATPPATRAAQSSSSRTTASASNRPRRVRWSRSGPTPDQIPLRPAPGSRRRSVADKRLELEAVAQPDLEQHPFEVSIARRLRISRAWAGDSPGGQPGRVGRRVLHVPPAHPTDVAVRSRTDPPPVVPAPVAEIVPAAAPRASGPSCSPRTPRSRRRSARSSASRYLSARSSSSGGGNSPRRTRAASRVPGSTTKAYALMWSGSAARAVSRLTRQSASDSPGVP